MLAFIGGAVADRLQSTQGCPAADGGDDPCVHPPILTLTHTVRVWHIVVLAALLGVVNAFDMPGRQAFVVMLVEKDDLMNAIALNSSIFNGARVLGPAVAGMLIAGIGEGWCFFANAVSYIAVIAGLLLMKLKPTLETGRSSSGLRNLMEGFQYVQRIRPIRVLLLLLALISRRCLPVLMPVLPTKFSTAAPRTAS
jgi:MFS family permease